MNDEIIFKKVNKKNIDQIVTLFNKVFNINISKKFYSWRYYNKYFKSYTSFIAIHNSKIIGHIGYFINTYNSKFYLASRHTSMIHNDYRSKNIYTNLLIFSFSIIKKEFNTNNILIWPNENNLKILNKLCFNPIIYKYNVYFKKFKTNKNKKLFSKDIKIYKNLNFSLFKNKIKSNKYLFNKNISYFQWRYLKYRKEDYLFIVLYNKTNEIKSIFVIKQEIQNKTISFSILDYIYFYKYSFLQDFNYLISNKDLLISEKNFNFYLIKLWCNNKDTFLKKFLKTKNFILNNEKQYYLSYLNIAKKSIKTKKIINKNNIFMGDTDNFIYIND